MNGIVRVDSHQGFAMTLKKKQQQLQQQQSTNEHSSPSGNTNGSMSNINGKAYQQQQQHQQHHHGRGPRPTLNNVSSLGLNPHPAPVSTVVAPSMVSNAMTSTIGWAKDETDKLLELEYKEEIFQYMKQMEKETMAVPEHMDLQPELTWDLRPLLVDFLIEIHTHFGLQPETLYLAMNMMDRYLSKRVVYKKHYQLVGMTSLWISSKYEDSKEKLPSVSQLCKLCSNTYDEAAFITMERHILKTLDYGLGHPTAEAFLKKDLELSGGQEDLRLRHVAQFLMELTMFTRCFLSFGSSTIAASALFLARSICGHPLVIPEDPNAFDCIRYLDNSLTNVSKTVHEKYARQRLSQASIVVKDWVDAGGRALIQPISTTTDGSNPLWTLSNMLWQPPSPIPTTFPTQGGASVGHPPSTAATVTIANNNASAGGASVTGSANASATSAAGGGAAATTTTTTTTTTTVTTAGVAVATTSSMTTSGGTTDPARDGYYSSSNNGYQPQHHQGHHQPPPPQQQQQQQRSQQQQQQQQPPPQQQQHPPSHQMHSGRHHSHSASSIHSQYAPNNHNSAYQAQPVPTQHHHQQQYTQPHQHQQQHNTHSSQQHQSHNLHGHHQHHPHHHHHHQRTGSSLSAHHVSYATLPQQPQPAVITHQTTYDIRSSASSMVAPSSVSSVHSVHSVHSIVGSLSDCAGSRWVDINMDM